MFNMQQMMAKAQTVQKKMEELQEDLAHVEVMGSSGGGRVAAYEVLIGTSAVANLIREGKTVQLKSVMQTGRNLGMQTMNDHLLQHVKNDLITPEEAYMKSNDKQLMKSLLQQEGFKVELPAG